MKKLISLLTLIVLFTACSSDEDLWQYGEEKLSKSVEVNSSEMIVPILAADIDREDIKDQTLTIDLIQIAGVDIDNYKLYYDYEQKGYRIKVYSIDEKYFGYNLDIQYTYSLSIKRGS